MDIEILQKYKSGGTGEYTLVYKSEGKDDPFGDMPPASEELSGEIAISLAGEVTMAATMGEDLEKILDTYGTSEGESISAYTNHSEYGSAPEKVLAPIREDEEEEHEHAKAHLDPGFECMACEKVYRLPGICEDCKVVLKHQAE